MGTKIVILAYLGVAAFVIVSAYYQGVVLHRREPLFTSSDRFTLAAVSVAAGILWPLFVPGLMAVMFRIARRALARTRRGWLLHARATRAKT
jgi:hypothetical protein